jgi:hypothetical protein
MKRIKTYLLPVLLGCPAMYPATVNAQTSLPYYTGFDNSTEKAGWQQFRLGTTGTTTANWVYSSSSPFSGASCLQHSYPVGGTALTDNWYVSPEFDFAAGASMDSMRSKFSGPGNPFDGDTVAVYLLSGNPDPAKATRKLLFDYRGAAYNNDNTWQKTAAFDIPPTSGKSYIAIRYSTVNNWLDAAFDNIAIRSKATTHTPAVMAATPKISCYPNPVRNTLFLSSSVTILETVLYDCNGRLVARQTFSGSIDMHLLPAGTYILQLLSGDGVAACERIVRE